MPAAVPSLATSLAALSAALAGQNPLATHAPAASGPIARPADPPPAVLYAVGAEGELEPLAVVDFGGRAVQAIAPLLARSERRPRVGLAREGLRFVLASNGRGLDAVDELSVRAVEHPVDSQVFFASRGGSAPRAPRRARRAR